MYSVKLHIKALIFVEIRNNKALFPAEERFGGREFYRRFLEGSEFSRLVRKETI